MKSIDPYLFFDGHCAEAMHFYADTLGGKVEVELTYGQNPEAASKLPGSEQRAMHVSVLLPGAGERRLMASDRPADQAAKPMQGNYVSLGYDTPEEAKKVFEALAAGGQTEMAFAPTFWSKGFGSCIDRFGTPWMVSGGIVPPP